MEEDERNKKLRAGKEKLAAFLKKKSKKKHGLHDKAAASSDHSVEIADSSSMDQSSSSDLPLFEDSDPNMMSDDETTTQDSKSLFKVQTKLKQAIERIAELEECLEGKQLALDRVINENTKLKETTPDVKMREMETALSKRDEIIRQLTTRLQSAASLESDASQLSQHVQHLQTQLINAGKLMESQNSKQSMSSQALSQAKTEIEALQKCIEDKDKLLNQLSEKVESISSEYGRLKMSYELTKQKEEESVKVVKSLMSDAEEQRKQKSSMTVSNPDINVKVQEVRLELEETYGKQIALMKEELSKHYQTKIETVLLDLNNMKDACAECQNQQKHLEHENLSLKSNNETYMTYINELQSQLTLVNSRLLEIQNEKDDVSQQNLNLSAEIQNYMTKFLQTENVSDQSVEEVNMAETVSKETDKMAETVSKETDKMAELYERNLSLCSELEKLQKDYIEAQNQIENFKKKTRGGKSARFEVDSQEIVMELKQVTEQYEEALVNIALMHAKIEDYDIKCENLTDDLLKMKERYENQAHTVMTLENQVKEYEQKHVILSSQLQKMTESCESAQKQSTEYRDKFVEYEQQMTDYEGLVIQFNELQHECNVYQTHNDELNNKMNIQQDVVMELKAELEILTNQNQAYQEQALLHAQSLGDMETENKSLQEIIDRYKDEVTKLTNDLNLAAAEVDSYKEKTTSLESKISNLERELRLEIDVESKQKDELIKKLNARISDITPLDSIQQETAIHEDCSLHNELVTHQSCSINFNDIENQIIDNVGQVSNEIDSIHFDQSLDTIHPVQNIQSEASVTLSQLTFNLIEQQCTIEDQSKHRGEIDTDSLDEHESTVDSLEESGSKDNDLWSHISLLQSQNQSLLANQETLTEENQNLKLNLEKLIGICGTDTDMEKVVQTFKTENENLNMEKSELERLCKLMEDSNLALNESVKNLESNLSLNHNEKLALQTELTVVNSIIEEISLSRAVSQNGELQQNEEELSQSGKCDSNNVCNKLQAFKEKLENERLFTENLSREYNHLTVEKNKIEEMHYNELIKKQEENENLKQELRCLVTQINELKVESENSKQSLISKIKMVETENENLNQSLRKMHDSEQNLRVQVDKLSQQVFRLSVLNQTVSGDKENLENRFVEVSSGQNVSHDLSVTMVTDQHHLPVLETELELENGISKGAVVEQLEAVEVTSQLGPTCIDPASSVETLPTVEPDPTTDQAATVRTTCMPTSHGHVMNVCSSVCISSVNHSPPNFVHGLVACDNNAYDDQMIFNPDNNKNDCKQVEILDHLDNSLNLSNVTDDSATFHSFSESIDTTFQSCDLTNKSHFDQSLMSGLKDNFSSVHSGNDQDVAYVSDANQSPADFRSDNVDYLVLRENENENNESSEHLRNENTILKVKLEDTQNDMSEMLSDRVELVGSMENFSDKINDLRNHLDKVMEENKLLRRNLEESNGNSEVRGKLEDKIIELVSENKKLKQECIDSHMLLQTKNESLQTIIQSWQESSESSKFLKDEVVEIFKETENMAVEKGNLELIIKKMEDDILNKSVNEELHQQIITYSNKLTEMEKWKILAEDLEGRCKEIEDKLHDDAEVWLIKEKDFVSLQKELTDKCACYKMQITQLEETCTHYNNQIDHLSKQCSTYEIQIKDLQDACVTYENINKELSEKRINCENQYKELALSLNSSKENLRESQDKYITCEKHSRELLQKCLTLEKQLTELNETCSVYERSKEELEVKCTCYEKHLKEIVEVHKTQSAEKQEVFDKYLNDQLEAYNMKLAAIQETLSKELKEKQEEHDIHLREIQEVHKKDLSELQESHDMKVNEMIKTHENQLTENLEAHDLRIIEIQQAHEKLLTKNQKEYENQSKQVQERYRKDLSDLTEKHESQVIEIHEAHKMQLTDVCKAHEKQLIEIQEEHEKNLVKIQKELNEMQEVNGHKVTELESNISLLQLENNALGEKVLAQEKDLQEINTKYSDLIENHNELCIQNEEMNIKVQYLEHKIHEKEAECSKLTETNFQFKNSCDETVSVLTEENKEWIKKCKNLELKIKAVKTKNSELVRTNIETKEHLEQKMSNLTSENEDLSAKYTLLEQTCLNLETSKTEVIQEKDNLETELAEMILRLSDQNTELTGNLQNIKMENQVVSEKLAESEKRLQDVSLEYESLKGSYEESKKELSRMELENKNLMSDMKTNNEEVEDMQQSLQEIMVELEQTQKTVLKLQEDQIELKNKKDMLEKENDVIAQQKENLSLEIEQLSEALENVEVERSELVKSYDLTEQSLRDMQANYESLIKLLQDTKNQCGNEIALLKSQLNKVSEEFVSLRTCQEILQSDLNLATSQKLQVISELEQEQRAREQIYVQNSQLQQELKEKCDKDLHNQGLVDAQHAPSNTLVGKSHRILSDFSSQTEFDTQSKTVETQVDLKNVLIDVDTQVELKNILIDVETQVELKNILIDVETPVEFKNVLTDVETQVDLKNVVIDVETKVDLKNVLTDVELIETDPIHDEAEINVGASNGLINTQNSTNEEPGCIERKSYKIKQNVCTDTCNEIIGQNEENNDEDSIIQEQDCNEMGDNLGKQNVCTDKEVIDQNDEELISEEELEVLIQQRIDTEKKQIEYDMEEKYEIQFRQRQVDVMHKFDQKQKELQKNFEQQVNHRLESLRAEKDQAFVKALQKMKKDFEKRHRKEMEKQRLAHLHEMAIMEDERKGGGHISDVVQKLHQENQELAEARDFLLQQVELSRHHQEQLEDDLRNMMEDGLESHGDFLLESNQLISEQPRHSYRSQSLMLDWEFSPCSSFDQDIDSPGLSATSIDDICSNTRCLMLRRKYLALKNPVMSSGFQPEVNSVDNYAATGPGFKPEMENMIFNDLDEDISTPTTELEVSFIKEAMSKSSKSFTETLPSCSTPKIDAFIENVDTKEDISMSVTRNLMKEISGSHRVRSLSLTLPQDITDDKCVHNNGHVNKHHSYEEIFTKQKETKKFHRRSNSYTPQKTWGEFVEETPHDFTQNNITNNASETKGDQSCINVLELAGHSGRPLAQECEQSVDIAGANSQGEFYEEFISGDIENFHLSALSEMAVIRPNTFLQRERTPDSHSEDQMPELSLDEQLDNAKLLKRLKSLKDIYCKEKQELISKCENLTIQLESESLSRIQLEQELININEDFDGKAETSDSDVKTSHHSKNEEITADKNILVKTSTEGMNDTESQHYGSVIKDLMSELKQKSEILEQQETEMSMTRALQDQRLNELNVIYKAELRKLQIENSSLMERNYELQNQYHELSKTDFRKNVLTGCNSSESQPDKDANTVNGQNLELEGSLEIYQQGNQSLELEHKLEKPHQGNQSLELEDKLEMYQQGNQSLELEDKCKEYQQVNQSLITQIQKLESYKSQMESDLMDKVGKREKLVKELTEKCQIYETDINSKQLIIKGLEKKCSSMETEIHSKISGHNSSEVARLKELQEKCHDMEIELEYAKQNEVFKCVYEDKCQQYEAEIEDKLDCERELMELTERHKKLENDLKTQGEKYQSELKSCYLEIEVLQEKCKNFETDLTGQNSLLQENYAKWENYERELKLQETNEALMKNLEDKCQSYLVEIEELRKKCSDLALNLKFQRQKNERMKKEMDGKCERYEKQIKHNEKTLDEIHETCSKFEIVGYENEHVIRELTSQCNKYQSEIQKLRAKELQKMKKTLSCSMDEIEMTDIYQEEVSNSQLVESNKTIASLVAESKSEYQTAVSSLDECQKLVAEEICVLETNDMTETNNPINNGNENMEERVIELECLLKDKEKLIKKFKIELERREEELSGLEDLKQYQEHMELSIREKDSYIKQLEEHFLQQRTPVSVRSSVKTGKYENVTKQSEHQFEPVVSSTPNLEESVGSRIDNRHDDINDNCSDHSTISADNSFSKSKSNDSSSSGKMDKKSFSNQTLSNFDSSLDGSEKLTSRHTLIDESNSSRDLQHFAIVEEISRLRQDLRETKSVYTQENALLREALDKEKWKRDSKLDTSFRDVEQQFTSELVTLRQKVSILMETNDMLRNENDKWLTRIQEQESIVLQLRTNVSQDNNETDADCSFSQQLKLLQQQRNELVEKLNDCENKVSTLSQTLGEKSVLEETYRREKAVLHAKLYEMEEVEKELTEKKIELEKQKSTQKRLEEIIYHRDLIERELMKQKRLLEVELAEIECKLHEKEELLEIQKNQLLEEIKQNYSYDRNNDTSKLLSTSLEGSDFNFNASMITPPSSRASPQPQTREVTPISERRVKAGRSLSQYRHLGNVNRLELMLHDVEKEHAEAISYLKEKLQKEQESQDTTAVEQHQRYVGRSYKTPKHK